MSDQPLKLTIGRNGMTVRLEHPVEFQMGFVDPAAPVVQIPEDAVVTLLGGGNLENLDGSTSVVLFGTTYIHREGREGDAYVLVSVDDLPPGSFVDDPDELDSRMMTSLGIPGPAAVNPLAELLDSKWDDDDRSVLYAEGPDDLPF